MRTQDQYKKDKQKFFRCIFQGDANGLAAVVHASDDWILDGMVKSAQQQQWECLKVLADANVYSQSPWDIRNCAETILFNSEPLGHSRCIEVMLDFIDAHELQIVAEETLLRAVLDESPNAVDTAKLLWRYVKKENHNWMLERSVSSRNVALVEFFASKVPLKLTTEPEGLVDEADLFGLLLLAARPYTGGWNANTPAHEVAHIQTQQTDVLNILLRNVDPEILAQCLSLASKDDQYNSVLLNDWIDQQRLQKTLTQAVGLETGSLARKRKV